MSRQRSLWGSILVFLVLSLTLVACMSAQVPAPTTKPAEPAKPAATTPAQVPAATPAQPTAAPVKKSDFPIKGKAITIIVPFAAGGPNDVAGRLLGAAFEKELGTSVEIVNKAGASTQVAMSDLARSKPDGHTLAYSTIPTSLVYLDPERKADYGAKDLTVVAQHAMETGCVSVNADSPFKTLKDLLDYARANPGKLRAADNGILTFNNINMLETQKLAGVQFAPVHFDGAAPQLTALLGGHVDLIYTSVASSTVGPHKSGQIRVLAVTDKAPSKQLPDVPTFESQGVKLYGYSSYSLWAPAGVPADIVATLDGIMKKTLNDPEHQKKMVDIGMSPNYMGNTDIVAFWHEQEVVYQEFLKQAKEEQK